MNNLRKVRGTIKGNVGEAIFVSTFGHIHGTKLDSYHYLVKLPFTIPEKYMTFLKENWATIDAFEFILDENKNTIIGLTLYEIKTMNYYRTKGINFGKRPKLTHHAQKLYELANSKSIQVKSAWIVFHEDWNYEIIIKPFQHADYDIWSGNKMYTKDCI